MLPLLDKKCPKCGNSYPLTQEFFYPARKLDRKKIGWQSYCKFCWKDINSSNKKRRKQDKQIFISQYFQVL